MSKNKTRLIATTNQRADEHHHQPIKTQSGWEMTNRENFSSNAQDSSAVGEHLTLSHTDP